MRKFARNLQVYNLSYNTEAHTYLVINGEEVDCINGS